MHGSAIRAEKKGKIVGVVGCLHAFSVVASCDDDVEDVHVQVSIDVADCIIFRVSLRAAVLGNHVDDVEDVHIKVAIDISWNGDDDTPRESGVVGYVDFTGDWSSSDPECMIPLGDTSHVEG